MKGSDETTKPLALYGLRYINKPVITINPPHRPRRTTTEPHASS